MMAVMINKIIIFVKMNK